MISDVWEALENSKKTVVAQIAPSVRVALGEEFGSEPGTLVIGKIYSALKNLGVDYVFDTNFSADLTIMEEGTELLNRIAEKGPLPLITSCSPDGSNSEKPIFLIFWRIYQAVNLPSRCLEPLSKPISPSPRGLILLIWSPFP